MTNSLASLVNSGNHNDSYQAILACHISIKRKQTLLCSGRAHLTGSTTEFHFCFSEEVSRHMTWTSWCESLCLFKVQATSCRLVKGRHCRYKSCFSRSLLAFPPDVGTEINHSVWTAQHRWQGPPRAWKLPYGSHKSTGKNIGDRLWVAWIIFLISSKCWCICGMWTAVLFTSC